MIKLVACMDGENGIGKDNKLLAHLPEDLQHFKEITLGKTCVFGRTTFESLPKRPLSDRDTIILTKDTNYHYAGCRVIHSVEDIIGMSKVEDIYICGGAEIYKQFIPYADELIITQYEEVFDADTFFPEINEDVWIPYYCEGVEDKLDFDIIKYKRKY